MNTINHSTHPLFCAADDGLCARVMGILNVTPDSFSDGGQFTRLDMALNQVEQMLMQGASIIDIGGESTRPGAVAVNAEQELERVIPVIEAVKQRFDCAVSIDTSKATVMAAAAAVGVDMINDVMALQGDGCIEVLSRTQLPVCLMHMQGQPRTMQHQPQYNDVVEDIINFMAQRVQICADAGILQRNICIDPGFGFGKTSGQNYQLLNRLEQFKTLGLPLLAGLSRKSMIGNVLNVAAEQRLIGSISCAVIALMKGATVIRVHDVKATVEALKIVTATRASLGGH